MLILDLDFYGDSELKCCINLILLTSLIKVALSGMRCRDRKPFNLILKTLEKNSLEQGCQMVYLHTQNPNSGKF
jgi:hypothetical protein